MDFCSSDDMKAEMTVQTYPRWRTTFYISNLRIHGKVRNKSLSNSMFNNHSDIFRALLCLTCVRLFMSSASVHTSFVLL